MYMRFAKSCILMFVMMLNITHICMALQYFERNGCASGCGAAASCCIQAKHITGPAVPQGQVYIFCSWTLPSCREWV